MLKTTLIILAVLLGMGFLVWLGLQVKPAPFSPFAAGDGSIEYRPLPEGLPAPVERFYQQVYGQEIPVIESAVISGRALIKPMGNIRLPARFRFIHEAGQNYRHEIVVTFFGIPIMRVDETYIDGGSRLALPFGVVENEPNINQAANLGLWAESIWLPSLFLTDPRVSWQPFDAHTAVLVVPFEDQQERFIVRFNAETGLVDLFEAMRYKEADDAVKTLWISDAIRWGELDGRLVLLEGGLTWYDDRQPWANFTVEEIVYNQDVTAALREGSGGQ